jgi:hypothetical protein
MKGLHMKGRDSQTPNMVAEVFMSTFKIFSWITLFLIVVTNIVWAVIYFKPSPPRTGDTHVEITQNGDRDVVTQKI